LIKIRKYAIIISGLFFEGGFAVSVRSSVKPICDKCQNHKEKRKNQSNRENPKHNKDKVNNGIISEETVFNTVPL
jgi:ribosomal protein L36